MPNNNGQLTAPLGIASVAQCTGNPMLDVGYQCMDCKPYFQYSSSAGMVYSPTYPTGNVAAVSASSLMVYSVGSKVMGSDYMQRTYSTASYLGTATAATATSITYNGIVYTYTNSYANCRLFLVNKWAKNKPFIPFLKSGLIDDGPEDKTARAGISIQTSSAVSDIVTRLNNKDYGWDYIPPQITDWKRLADFVGYYAGAKSPMVFDSSEKPDKVLIDGRYYYTFYTDADPLVVNLDLGVTEDTASVTQSIDAFEALATVGPTLALGYGLVVDGVVQDYISSSYPNHPVKYATSVSESSSQAFFTMYCTESEHETMSVSLARGVHQIDAFIVAGRTDPITFAAFPTSSVLVAVQPLPLGYTYTYNLSWEGTRFTPAVLDINIQRNTWYSSGSITDIRPVNDLFSGGVTKLTVTGSDGTVVTDMSGDVENYSGQITTGSNPTNWAWAGGGAPFTVTTTAMTGSDAATFSFMNTQLISKWRSNSFTTSSNVTAVDYRFTLQVTYTIPNTGSNKFLVPLVTKVKHINIVLNKADFTNAGFFLS